MELPRLKICGVNDAAFAAEAERCGANYIGVIFADGSPRRVTPAQAKEIGSDYIVVGRPITAAEDPVAAQRRCVKEIC